MKDEIISLKTVKLAKEKGFNIPTLIDYYENIFRVWGEVTKDWNSMENHYSVPTQSLLQKWLREEHSIYVQPFYDNPEWRVAICDPDEKQLGNYSQDENMTYEESLECGLQEALKLI